MDWNRLDTTIAKELRNIRDGIRFNMDTTGVNASGATSRSIEATGRQILASEVLEKTETGTPPRSQGGGISFPAALFWVEAKPANINPWALVARINAKGSRTYQRGGRKDIYTPELEEAESERFVGQVGTAIEFDIMDFLDSELA